MELGSEGFLNNLISITGKELRSIACNRRQTFTGKDQVCQELVSVIGKEVVFISGKELVLTLDNEWFRETD